jgi:hypothetical protein
MTATTTRTPSCQSTYTPRDKPMSLPSQSPSKPAPANQKAPSFFAALLKTLSAFAV